MKLKRLFSWLKKILRG
ncbi:hypothetical protein GlitD10_2427, partial [Gloeomargarita lithophora Alchichica-D10]